MIITIDYLAARRACQGHLDIFAQLYPAGMDIDTVTAEELVSSGLDLEWAAAHILSGHAWSEYQRVRGPALAEYDRVHGLAWSEYQREQGPAWAECERVQAEALLSAVRAHGVRT